VIAFTDDWAEDAARRDFTINALYAAANGEIFDYATGMEDLIAGRVRFMGDATSRIAEDYLRVLRLFRFHAWYGRGEIDAGALHAAAAAKDKLGGLSAERIAKEMLRQLEALAPAPVLRVMAATGILGVILPGTLDLARLERLCEIDGDNLFAPDALLRLAALLAPQDRDAVAVRLKLSNADRARLAGASDGPEKIAAHLSVQAVRRLLYAIGPAAFADRVHLAWAAAPRSQPAIQWRMLLAMAKNWERPRFPLNGADVMAAGVPEGAGVGRVLAQLQREWADEDFATDETVLRARLAALAAAGGWTD
jgi:poly(A) polymerase